MSGTTNKSLYKIRGKKLRNEGRESFLRSYFPRSECDSASCTILFICLLVETLRIKIKVILLWSCLAVTDSFSIAIVTERSAFMNRLRFLRLEFPAKKRTQGGENRGKSRQWERKQIEVLISQLCPLESAGTHQVRPISPSWAS